MKRAGKLLQEWLLERGVSSIETASGEYEDCMLFSDPRPLAHGKGPWQCFKAGTDFSSGLRKRGCRGWCLWWCVFDGENFQSILHAFQGRHELYYSEMGPQDDSATPELRATDLTMGSRCGLHVVSKAVERSIEPHSSDGILGDSFVSVRGLKSSTTVLAEHIMEHIQRNGRPDPTPPSDAYLLQEFWQALSVDCRWIQQFVFVNPRWDGKVLFFNPQLLVTDDGMNQLYGCVFYGLQERLFSLTRWVAGGESSQKLSVSFCVGITGLFDITMKSPHVKTYDLHTFERCNTDVKFLTGVLAISTHPAQTLQAELLKDDRALLRYEEVFGGYFYWDGGRMVLIGGWGVSPTGKSFRFVRACERARRGEAAWASERRFAAEARGLVVDL